jgi:hypothetical protein
MEENAIIKTPEADSSLKTRTLMIGAVVGALTGLGAAYLLMRRADQEGKPLAITSGQGLKLGMMLTSLLRQIMSLGKD